MIWLGILALFAQKVLPTAILVKEIPSEYDGTHVEEMEYWSMASWKCQEWTFLYVAHGIQGPWRRKDLDGTQNDILKFQDLHAKVRKIRDKRNSRLKISTSNGKIEKINEKNKYLCIW